MRAIRSHLGTDNSAAGNGVAVIILSNLICSPMTDAPLGIVRGNYNSIPPLRFKPPLPYRHLVFVHKSQHFNATWVRAISPAPCLHGSADFTQFVTPPPPLPRTPKRVRLFHAIRIVCLISSKLPPLSSLPCAGRVLAHALQKHARGRCCIDR